MALSTGREGTITNRDTDVFAALFFCRYLTTKQLASLFFPGPGKTRTRLSKLNEKGYVKNRTMYVVEPKSWDERVSPQGVWHLTRDGFDSVAETLGLDEAYTPKQLLPEKARHYVRTNEVYVAAKEFLDEELGPYPQWKWRHEKRVAYAGEYANAPYAHNPDAHILFRDHVFIIERQTAESKIGPKALEKKLRDHKRYAELVLKNGNDAYYYETEKACEDVEVLFACEDAVVAERAERAGRQYGIRVVGGDVAGIADYLYSSALRLS